MIKPNSLALYVSMWISAGYCPCWDAPWLWLCLMLVEASLRSLCLWITANWGPSPRKACFNASSAQSCCNSHCALRASAPHSPRSPPAADSLLQPQSSYFTSVYTISSSSCFFLYIRIFPFAARLTVCLLYLERLDWKWNVWLYVWMYVSPNTPQKLIAAIQGNKGSGSVWRYDVKKYNCHKIMW